MADKQIPQDRLEAVQQGSLMRAAVAEGQDDLSYLALSSGLDEEDATPGLESYLGRDAPEGERVGAAPRGASYADESSRLFILKEFTPNEFAAWFKAQNLGAAPYNGVGVHHTYIPTSEQYRGIGTLQGVFNYYRDQRGWPYGLGPHLWLIDGHGAYRHGQPLVAVGTHPRHDGIGISFRNHRWLHIEGLFNGDAGRMSKEMEDLYRFVLRVVCGQRGSKVKFVQGVGVDGPTSFIGCLFHRDARTNPKTCPGRHTTHDWFDASMMQATRPRPSAVTSNSRLRARPRTTLSRMQRYLSARPQHGEYTDDDVRLIARYYFGTAGSVGLDPLIAFAQMIHETAGLTSWWSQRPRRNPAGIGVTGEPGAGVSFPSWEVAVKAHVGRLLAYAVPRGRESDAQRALIDEALRARPLPDRYLGSAPTLRKLAGTWATDPEYAAKISRVANEIRSVKP